MASFTGSQLIAARPSELKVTDPRFILQVLATRGLTIKDPTSSDLFAVGDNLKAGTISKNEYLGICMSLVCPVVGISVSPEEFVETVSSIAEAIEAEAKKIRDQDEHELETDPVIDRPVQILATAKNLEPVSRWIIAAAEEVIHDSYDDDDMRHAKANSTAIRKFLTEEILPLLGNTGASSVASMTSNSVHQKRADIEKRFEAQRTNVNTYILEAQRGIDNMTDENYHRKTNYLPSIAAAAALELLLRCYHILLGRFDPQDITIVQDIEDILTLAKWRVDCMRRLLGSYQNGRCKLLSQQSTLRDLRVTVEHTYLITDAGSFGDILWPRQLLHAIDTYVGTPSDVTTRIIGDDSFRYQHRNHSKKPEMDKAQIYGSILFEKAGDEMQAVLRPDGLIWRTHFQPYVDRIEKVLTAALDGEERERDCSLTSESLRKWPRTVPVKYFRSEDWSKNATQCASRSGVPIYHMVYHQLGTKISGEYQPNKDWRAYIDHTSRGVKVQNPTKIDFPRCEILVDTSAYDWVTVLNGQPPEHAVNMSENSKNTPFYIARVRRNMPDGRIIYNPAELRYRQEEKGWECPTAMWADLQTVKYETEYQVLCYRQSKAEKC